jgi:L-ribulokinase
LENGGKLSAELALPKILETRAQAPKVYDAAYRFMDVGDWLTLILTGKEVRSPAFAGFKFLYTKESGYPKNEFFASLTPSLDGIIGTKIPSEVAPTIAMRAGELSERGSEITGLPVGTALSLPMIDAHASLAGLNVTGDGEMVIIIGTSSCHIINSINKTDVSGIFGYAKDAVFPGLYTYEAGQCAVGDMFDWYVKNALPASYEREAEALGIGAHKLLREKAKKLEIGESGIVALDWWSGNRSILADSTLKGMIYGLTMATKPEEIYRALLESVTFGARVILEQFESQGVKIGKINAAGGIAKKDDLLMQIYADVLDKDIYIAESSQSAALGSAVYAAAAAGIYPSIEAAAKKFAKAPQKVYHPIRENVKKYDALYKKYRALHDHFAKNKI